MYNELRVLYGELDVAVRRASVVAAQADERHANAVAQYERSAGKSAEVIQMRYRKVEETLSARGRCATILKDLEAARNRARIQMQLLKQEYYDQMRERTGSFGYHPVVGMD